MALRRNLQRPKPSRFERIFFMSLSVLLGVGLLIGGFILYFNGNNVKDPLMSILNDRSGLNFSAQNVEFSPIYPDTIKLSGVTLENSTIEEAYIEYDLKSLLNKDCFVIKDLYLKGVSFSKKSFAVFKKHLLGFNSIHINKLSIKDIKLNSEIIKSSDASLKFSELTLYPKKEAAFKSGEIAFPEGYLEEVPVKNFYTKIEEQADSYRIKDFEINAFAGVITAEGAILKNSSSIALSRLNLNNVVFKDQSSPVFNHQISAANCEISDSVLVLNKKDLLLSGISGSIENFELNPAQDSVFGKFQGKIEEISKPEQQITLTGNRVSFEKASIDPIRFDLSGNVFEGNYTLKGEFDSTDDKLIINSLALNNNKLHLTEKYLQTAQEFIKTRFIGIEHLHLSNIEFLSHIDAIPLSVKSITAALNSVCLDKAKVTSLNNEASVSLDAQETLYADLEIKKINLKSKLSGSTLSLEVPVLIFKNSGIDISGKLDTDTLVGELQLKGDDIELSELNCSFIPNYISGSSSFQIGLKNQSPSKTIEEMVQTLSGQAELKAQNAIISNLGLDLINGGSTLGTISMPFSDLIYSLRASDCGIEKAAVTSVIENGNLKVKANLSLNSSYVESSGTVNLQNNSLDIKSYFVSKPHDSISILKIKSTESAEKQDLTCSIKAITRGESRPGIRLSPSKDLHFKDNDGIKSSNIDKAIEKLNQVLAEDTEKPATVEKALEELKETKRIASETEQAASRADLIDKETELVKEYTQQIEDNIEKTELPSENDANDSAALSKQESESDTAEEKQPEEKQDSPKEESDSQDNTDINDAADNSSTAQQPPQEQVQPEAAAGTKETVTNTEKNIGTADKNKDSAQDKVESSPADLNQASLH